MLAQQGAEPVDLFAQRRKVRMRGGPLIPPGLALPQKFPFPFAQRRGRYTRPTAVPG